MFNKKGLIENTVEVNIYYQEYRERTEMDMIGGQKWSERFVGQEKKIEYGDSSNISNLNVEESLIVLN